MHPLRQSTSLCLHCRLKLYTCFRRVVLCIEYIIGEVDQLLALVVDNLVQVLEKLFDLADRARHFQDALGPLLHALLEFGRVLRSLHLL